uniref:Uncharacterized protein n=1 Tax=Anguilla anguilla TaxID=7936 RepID=A0A0E9WMX1_ANGAN
MHSLTTFPSDQLTTNYVFECLNTFQMLYFIVGGPMVPEN